MLEKEYALYKGDELLDMGTVKELARQFNVKIETIHYYNTPTYKRRTNPNRARRLVPLDWDEDE